MLYFIACHAPDIHGAKLADGLARVSISRTMPHMVFGSRELAQYYIDVRNASKLCYIVSEDDMRETLWYDFSDGVICFKSIKDIRKALQNHNHLHNLDRISYSPVVSAF